MGARGWGASPVRVCACVPQGPHTQPSKSKPIFPGLPPLSRSFLPHCTRPPPAKSPLFSHPLHSCLGALPDSFPALGSLLAGSPAWTWQCSVRIFCGDIRPLTMQVSQHLSPSTTHLPGKACDCGSEYRTQTPPPPFSSWCLRWPETANTQDDRQNKHGRLPPALLEDFHHEFSRTLRQPDRSVPVHRTSLQHSVMTPKFCFQW